ncbi:MAG: hypothetical protein AAGG38_09200 [Planctomycetota bacterium]
MTYREPQPADLVALSMTAKGKPLTEAKGAIADGSSQPVHLVAEIRGHLQRGKGSPAASGMQPADASLATYRVMLALVTAMGIGPKKLTAALAHATEHVASIDDVHQLGLDAKAAKLDAVIRQATDQLNSSLPQVPFNVRATPGRLSFDVDSLIFHDLPENCPCSLAA